MAQNQHARESLRTNPTRMNLTFTRRRSHRPFGRVAVVSLLVVGSIAAFGGGAGAAPVADKQQQAADLQDQIEASDLQISGLAEGLLQAQARQDAAQSSAQAAEAQIADAKKEVDRILGLVKQNLASLYRRTLRGQSVGEMDFSATVDLLKRSQYAETTASRDSELLDQLDAAQEDLGVQRDNATQARDKAAAEAQQITEAKTAIETARAAQQAILDKVTGELKAAVAAEQARRAQATQAKIATSSAPEKFIDVGPPNGSAAQAIAYARQAIGSPYSTSPRMGPSYDCSGLTTMAWRAAGISIPSTSGSQYAGLPHVPMNALQPGDLIFWGPGGSDHVALYIGGGTIIDASSSAHAVTQRGIWGSPIGAARVL